MKMMAAVSEWGTIMSGPYFRCMLAMATSWLIRQSSPATGAVRGAEQHHWDERKRVAYQQHHYFYSHSSVLPALSHLYSVHSPPNRSWSFNSATTHSRNVCLKGDVFGTMEKVILFSFLSFRKNEMIKLYCYIPYVTKLWCLSHFITLLTLISTRWTWILLLAAHHIMTTQLGPVALRATGHTNAFCKSRRR